MSECDKCREESDTVEGCQSCPGEYCEECREDHAEGCWCPPATGPGKSRCQRCDFFEFLGQCASCLGQFCDGCAHDHPDCHF